MVNIIDRNSPSEIKAYAPPSSKLRSKGSASSKTFDADSSEDRVLLSPMARDIQSATNQLQDIPDVRNDRVAQIRQQIASGSYRVDTAKIARNIMSESLYNELL